MSGGRAVNPDHMVVSSGSKQSLFNACFTLFGPGQRVLIPGPAWVSYPQIVHLSRAEPILVPGDIEWGLKVSVRDLDAAYSKSVKGLILCSPCNPTGAVYTLAELKAIAEWAHKHQVWIISDEIYRRINYGPGPAASMLDLPDELLERTVLIYGASKAYAMTGWRIGAALRRRTSRRRWPRCSRTPRPAPITRRSGPRSPLSAMNGWTRRSRRWWRPSGAGATCW